MTTSRYRLLVVLSLLTGVAAAAFDYLFPAFVPEGVTELLAPDDTDMSFGFTILLGVLALGFIVVGLAASYGLYMFRRWAPNLALLTTVLAVLVTSIAGATVYSGPASSLLLISSYLWGAVVLIPYIGEHRGWFSGTPTTERQVADDEWPTSERT